MALSAKLELRQSLSLVMTPQLLQAIKLLQLSNLDLVAYVDAELERNPLLERDDGERPSATEPTPDRPEEPAEQADGEGAGDWLETTLEQSSEAIAGKLDTDLGNVFPDDNGAPAEAAPTLPLDSWASAPSRQAVSAEDYNLEAFVAQGTSLAEHLLVQLQLSVADPTMRLIGRALIDDLDDAGYLRADLDEVADRLGAPRELAEATLAVVQGFEPTGVFARNLGECLTLQLRERNRFDPAMERLLAHLDLVVRRDHAGLRRACGVDEDDLVEMLAELRRLDPKPGSGFDPAPVHPVIPDVLVHPGPDGGWLVELNSETLPRVLVNQVYYARVAGASRKDGERAYLSECFQTANWLVKSLDQRARTILKVATEIVRQQDGFLTRGVRFLRPLNLKAVAEAIGMHESTVSRVTSNKYVATTRGIFELKYFFTSAIAASGGGEAHSAEAVRDRIKSLIEEEPHDAILSDDTIVKMLRGAGVDIARRTVAKYREAMRIPSSVQRRRDKQATA